MKSNYKNAIAILFVIPQVFLCKLIHASDIVLNVGARETALANSGVSLGGVWSVYYNPAGLVTVKSSSFGISYENKFMVKDLNTASCAIAVPSFKGTFGITCSYFGGTRYNEKKYAIAYAHALTKNLSAGILFDYYSASLPEEYDDCRTLAAELGILANPTEKLSLGMHVANITNSNYKNYSTSNVPQFLRTGASWTEEHFILSLQAQLGKNQETIISAATEINIVKSLAVRMGVANSECMRYTFGFGYTHHNIQADIAFVHHRVLGLSSSFNLIFRFPKH
jgi:hypothetical protein